jgi:hypothetical protein
LPGPDRRASRAHPGHRPSCGRHVGRARHAHRRRLRGRRARSARRGSLPRRGRHSGHLGANPERGRRGPPASQRPARLIRRDRHCGRPSANPDRSRHDPPANRRPARLIRRDRHCGRPSANPDRSRHDRSASRRFAHPSRRGRRARPGRTRDHCPRRPGRSSAGGPGHRRSRRGRCAAGGRRAGIPARAPGRGGPSHPAPTSRDHPRRPACGPSSCAPRSSRQAGRRTTRHVVPVHAVTPRAGRRPIRAAGRPRSEHPHRSTRFRCVPRRHPTHRDARGGRRLLVGSRRRATPRGPDGGVRVGPHAPGGRRDDLAAGGCRQNHPRYSPAQDTKVGAAAPGGAANLPTGRLPGDFPARPSSEEIAPQPVENVDRQFSRIARRPVIGSFERSYEPARSGSPFTRTPARFRFPRRRMSQPPNSRSAGCAVQPSSEIFTLFT